jgi:hypothetical protein
VNVPYDNRYADLEAAVVACLWAHGLVPVLGRDSVTSDLRIEKLAQMMDRCKLGVSDLSFRDRLNMPLELGMMLGGGIACAVLVKSKARLIRSSDLLGVDPMEHGNDPKEVIRLLSKWLHDHARRRVNHYERTIARLAYRRIRLTSYKTRDYNRIHGRVMPDIMHKIKSVIAAEKAVPPPGRPRRIRT